jgi:hypothetical protein
VPLIGEKTSRGAASRSRAYDHRRIHASAGHSTYYQTFDYAEEFIV